MQHLTLEMFTKPVMEVDAGLCQDIYDTAEHERSTTLSDLGTTLADLRSAPKFAALLTALGVSPPMKPSPANPEKLTYAFAKTIPGHDSFFCLWPFYFHDRTGIGTTNAAETYASLPFYSQLRSPQRDATTVLWPFFNYTDVS